MAAIKVGMRMRPMVGHEEGQKPCILISDKNVSCISENLSKHDKEMHPNVGPWTFDYAMDSSQKDSPDFCGNDGCYDQMGKPLVQALLDGYNSCLFCYGQTGTGKTATIMGYPGLGKGLLPRMLEDLMEAADEMRGEGCTVKVQCSVLEVYNEHVNDLLVDKKDWGKVPVKTAALPAGITIKGAQVREVTTLKDCEQILDEGDKRKTVFPTKMNPGSSRGHLVFKLVFHRSGGASGMKLDCEVYFADLAGHENIKMTAVTGDRLTELKNINSSLMYLQRAIHSLATSTTTKAKGSAKAKVNWSIFRNSELTMLLANGLTGNSKAAVIVTLSPAAQHFETSLSSIEFGLEVKGIKMDVHSVISVDPAAQIKKLEAEVMMLRGQLKDAQAGIPPAVSDSGQEGKTEGKKKSTKKTLRASQRQDGDAIGSGPIGAPKMGDEAPDAGTSAGHSSSSSSLEGVKPMSEENIDLMKENKVLKVEVAQLHHRVSVLEYHLDQFNGITVSEPGPGCCASMCKTLGLKKDDASKE